MNSIFQQPDSLSARATDHGRLAEQKSDGAVNLGRISLDRVSALA